MRKKIFIYPGSKTKVVDELIAAFPMKFRNMHWVDAFGGSGIVTYSKPRSSIETFNDYDKGISAIFYCLLFKFEELGFRLMEFNNLSESILKWIQSEEHQKDMENASIVDKAISKLYQINQSYSGKGESIGFTVDPDAGRSNRFTIFDYETWKLWRDRFGNPPVQLLSRPANDIIKSMDTRGMFVYCDPPYVVTHKGNHYEINFTEKDHIELAETLQNIEGYFLLSYDDTPLIQELYADYEINELMIRYTFKKNEGEKKKELLISNYKLPKRPVLTDYINYHGAARIEDF